MHVIVSGNVCHLRRSFDVAHIGGNYGEPDEAGRREYFRLPESAQLDDKEARARIEQSMTNALQNTLVRCIVRTAPSDEGTGREVLERLQSVSQLRF